MLCWSSSCLELHRSMPCQYVPPQPSVLTEPCACHLDTAIERAALLGIAAPKLGLDYQCYHLDNSRQLPCCCCHTWQWQRGKPSSWHASIWQCWLFRTIQCMIYILLLLMQRYIKCQLLSRKKVIPTSYSKICAFCTGSDCKLVSAFVINSPFAIIHFTFHWEV